MFFACIVHCNKLCPGQRTMCVAAGPVSVQARGPRVWPRVLSLSRPEDHVCGRGSCLCPGQRTMCVAAGPVRSPACGPGPSCPACPSGTPVGRTPAPPSCPSTPDRCSPSRCVATSLTSTTTASGYATSPSVTPRAVVPASSSATGTAPYCCSWLPRSPSIL